MTALTLASFVLSLAAVNQAGTATLNTGTPVFNALPIGSPAPDFDAFTPAGDKVTLSQFKGKVVILDFWASWCGPCQISMPGLEKIYQQVKDKNVVVLSLDTWDQKPDFQKWVQDNSGTKYHFNFVRDPAEGDHDTIRRDSVAKRLYNVIGIPTMYVIDRDGNVAGAVMGAGGHAALVGTLNKLGIDATLPEDR
ncbi:MAG TPA: TlpA disulfide reductase family protein [Fimbriimonadaceae bacterium]|nr:TlpA disulfide reductase family protein [Fimbriimonadaceae bacterium]